MKIACIATAQVPSITANSIQVMKVCHALTRNGHEVTLYVPGRQAAEWENFADLYGITQKFSIRWVPALPAWKRNDFAVQAVRLARRERAELIYTWAIQSAALALMLGMPAVYEAHDLPTGRLGPLWMQAFLRLPGRKRLVCITRALRRALEARLRVHLPEYQVVIAPNGVDLERYRHLPDPPTARAQVGLAQSLTVGCSGHLYAGRGGDLFLALAQRFPQAQFLWAGGRDEDVQTYRQRAQEQGLENVTFTGFIPQARLPLVQAAADILLMPYGRSIAGSSGGNSAEICSPMKLFDYLAVGRAILSSDLPVIREVLDEDTARFAPPEDVEGWAAALAPLLADETLRQRLAERARKRAEQYDWQERQQRILGGGAW